MTGKKGRPRKNPIPTPPTEGQTEETIQGVPAKTATSEEKEEWLIKKVTSLDRAVHKLIDFHPEMVNPPEPPKPIYLQPVVWVATILVIAILYFAFLFVADNLLGWYVNYNPFSG